MRLVAFVPVLLCAAALVLSFLCLFAGQHGGFMEDYAILTLNTSQIGESVFNTSESSSNPFINLFDNITNTIEDEIEGEINSFAKDLGLHDFYSIHVLDFCEGYYVPGPVANSTLSKSQIHKNVTKCSNDTAIYNFNPHKTLQQELNDSGHSSINVTQLGWPTEVDSAIQKLRIAAKAMFVLYCIGIALTFVAFALSIIGVFTEGRTSAFLNMSIDWLAFLALGIASAIATAIAIKAADVINDHGKDVGIQADKGKKFMILTWVATAIMFVVSLVWCCSCIAGRKNKGSSKLDG